MKTKVYNQKVPYSRMRRSENAHIIDKGLVYRTNKNDQFNTASEYRISKYRKKGCVCTCSIF